MPFFSKGHPQPIMPLSRTSSFSATSSSASSSKYDNSTMVTSRNLQCMPSDDEDDFDDDDQEEEEDDDDDDDNLLLCDTIKQTFNSVDLDYRRKTENSKRIADNNSNQQQKQQQRKSITTPDNQHHYYNHHLHHLQKQQHRHSIGLPIKNSLHRHHQSDRKSTDHHHINTSANHPLSTSNQYRHHHSKSPMPAPLLSMDPTTPPLTPTTSFNMSSLPGTVSSSTQNCLRHRSSLSGVDLIMAREQQEQKKKKNKPKKKWDSAHAPIGGLLAQLPQQGQHTISFQQQQQQLQQQQMRTIPFQHHQHAHRRSSNLMLPPSLLVLPRSPTSNMSRW
ncbi:unnamed protein product [Absidia cylindrospora]